VTFDGVAAPLLYASGTQINLVTPRALQGKTTTQVCISVNSVPLNCLDWPVQPAAPDIFLPPGQHWVTPDQNGVITLFLTGLGTMTPSPADGSIVQFPLPTQDLKIEVVFSWLYANFLMYTGYFSANGEILYAGPAPLEVEGLSQINVSLPSPPALDTSPPSGPIGPPSLGVLVILPDGTAIAGQQFIPVSLP
jgi:trimeric autotransporter adhesin